jgi:hydrogenase maturation factor
MSETPSFACVTCADELRSVVVEAVVEVGRMVTVIDAGERRLVWIDLVDYVRAGDVLLVHGGVALQREAPLGEQEAAR